MGSMLQTLFHPFVPSEWLAANMGKRFVHLADACRSLGSLLSWDEFNSLLRHIDPSRVHLSRDGQVLDSSAFLRTGHKRARSASPRLSAPDVEALVRSGATILIDEIDELHDPIGVLAQEFERELRLRVTVNLYASFGTKPGFGLHYDDHDVFVLQLIGEKRWDIYPPTKMFPLPNDRLARGLLPEGPASWVGIIRTGDALYVPRGWWHLVRPCSAESVHLTVGVANLTGVDLVMWASSHLAEQELFRAPLPYLNDTRELARHLERLAASLASELTKESVIETCLHHLAAVGVSRPVFGLPSTALPSLPLEGGDELIAVNALRALAARTIAPDGNLEVAIGETRMTFPSSASEVLAFLTSNPRVLVTRLFTTFETRYDRNSLKALVQQLADNGILTIGRTVWYPSVSGEEEDDHEAVLNPAVGGTGFR